MVTKLTLQYDGAEFAGWARQPGLRTVQAEVERALHTVLGETSADGRPLTLTVAGRTDRGVHAWGQVASYAHEAVDPRRLNGLLGEDVSILTSEPAPAGFDARRDALSRTYCYRVCTSRAREVFARRYALWWPHELDRDLLDACAQALHGTHDFTAFTPTDTDHVRFERDILRAAWRRGRPSQAGFAARRGGRAPERGRGRWEGSGEDRQAREESSLEFWIEADTFMRHMVRILVGTMLEVASRRRTLAQFEQLLQGRPARRRVRPRPRTGLRWPRSPTRPSRTFHKRAVTWGPSRIVC